MSALSEGDLVVLIDAKKRRYLVTLEAGGEFHCHAGVVRHADIIGLPEGSQVRSSHGSRFVVFGVTLSDFVLKMPRGAQVIYPKDLGPILMLADIFAGARVLESGVGSGALSMTLLRAGASVTGYELREDFAQRAERNVRSFLGDVGDRYRVEVRNVYDGIDDTGFDRVILDLPEPWQAVKHAAGALRPGGILVAYNPSVVQVMQLREALDEGRFDLVDTIEIMSRGWHVDGMAVRPNHRMVAHTGFLTHARLLAP
jgi:tRNA (adenine57-N1/adenine58-N1)-methyltransferase catalytic subunit